MSMELKAGTILEMAAQTYKERNAVYGDNYKRVGKAMQALFPNGVVLNGEASFNRWHILELIVVKLSRYAVAMERGGSHQDSLRDMAVYSAILEEIDTAIGFFNPPAPVEAPAHVFVEPEEEERFEEEPLYLPPEPEVLGEREPEQDTYEHQERDVLVGEVQP